MGWMKFTKPGKHRVSVSLVEGDPVKAELTAIKFTPVDFGSEPGITAKKD